MLRYLVASRKASIIAAEVSDAVWDAARFGAVAVLTKLGNTWTTWGAALAAGACLAVTWRHRKWLPPVALSAAIVIDHFTTLTLRHVFHRSGPPASPLATYPSGGCDRVILFYGLIAYLLWREFSGQRRTAIAIAAAVAALGFNEAYSRVYLSLHWFTDALSGLLYGSLLLAIFITAVHFAVGRPSQRIVRAASALAALPAALLAIGVPVGVGILDSLGQHPAVTGASHVTGPLVPAAGAYLGAYVQPTGYSWLTQVAAVKAFQRQIGRPLGLIHVYHPWSQPFPSQADRAFVDAGKVLLLTWGGTPDSRDIIAGRYDHLIMARAAAIRGLHRPILMEFRHEMDRPNLQWAVHGPAAYIKAWDHIRAIFRQAGAGNVGWVWCPTGYGFQVRRAQAFYPGNAEVDWVCADVYSFSPAESLQQAAAPFLTWASPTSKPVIIGEFAVNGPASAWAAWLTAAGGFAEKHPQIKAIAYFDANGKDSNGNPFMYWISDHKHALRSFARLAATAYFRPAIPREA